MDKKLKGILLDILDQFIQVCETHHLRYYLAYGTALGAVRHKGLIPWDDDIDVHMPREDYERLQTLPASVWGDMELTSWRLKKGNQYHFLKLENTNSTVIEQLDPLYVEGVYIDIFPLDKAPLSEDKLSPLMLRVRQLQEKYYIISIKHGCHYHGLVNYFKYRIRHCKYQNQPFQDDWDKLSLAYNASDERYYLDYHQPEDWHYKPMPIEWFGEGSAVDFEGRKFIVPENYEAYLTHIYGDYMTPPPEDKREGHKYLYVNLDERVSDKELKAIVRELRKKVAFRFSWKDEINYWKTKLKIK